MTPPLVNRILIAQFVATFFITAILIVVKRDAAFSALLGGMFCALPNMYFARQMFRYRTAEPFRLISSIYFAEFIKIALAVTLFAITFIKYKGVHPLALFVTYFVAHSCVWMVPIFISIPKTKPINR